MRSLTDVFYVKDFDGKHPELEKLVPAKFLIGLDGKPVGNPNSTLNTINKLDNHYFNADRTEIHDANPHNYLVVPVNYSIFTATDFAHRINRTDELSFSSIELMVKGFLSGGGEDLQRTYQNADGSMTQGGKFVPMFQDAASFHLGMVAQLTGYGASLAEIGGSAVEIVSKGSEATAMTAMASTSMATTATAMTSTVTTTQAATATSVTIDLPGSILLVDRRLSIFSAHAGYCPLGFIRRRQSARPVSNRG